MPTVDSKSMGKRVRIRREELSITRDKLAEMVGITPKFMGDIENGERGCSLKNLARLSNILMLSTDYILFGDTDKLSDQVIIQTFSKCPDSKRTFLLEIVDKIISSYSD